jgi:hypothetical protein
MPFSSAECADALAGIFKVAKCRSVCDEVLFCPFFPAVLYLVSSSTVNVTLHHYPPPLPSTVNVTTRFPNARHVAIDTLEWSLFEAPGQTGLCKATTVRPLQQIPLGAARRQGGERQVCIILNAALSLTKNILSRRETGWHGESGAACSGGHITVEFRSWSGHITTHHIYRTDYAY